MDLIKNNFIASKSLELLEISKNLQKEGKDIISLGVGDTHFNPPNSIMNNIINPLPGFSHYTLPRGILELREEIALSYGTSPENITVTNGVKQSLFYVLSILKDKKVCLLEPSWLGYEATLKICKKDIERFSYYNESIENLIFRNFKILILCSPNNPDGKVFTMYEIEKIIYACRLKQAIIIFDNIYKNYDYSGEYLKSIKLILNYEKLILIGGFSKSHAITGFRIGYVISQNYQFNNLLNLYHQHIATCAPSISQYSLLGLSNHLNSTQKFYAYYKENRDIVSKQIPLLEKYKPMGGFYYFFDLRIFNISDSNIFCKKLLNETGLVLIPGMSYGNFKSYVRMSFCVERKTLLDGINRLIKYIW